MAAPVDILIVAETAEIQRAFLDAEGFEWKTERLEDGGRYDWFTARIEGGRTWSAMLVCVEVPSVTQVAERLTRLSTRTSPRVIAFVGVAYASGGRCRVGDIVLPRTIWLFERPGEKGELVQHPLPQEWLEEARLFGFSKGWRDATKASVLLGKVAVGASLSDVAAFDSHVECGITPPTGDFLAVALIPGAVLAFGIERTFTYQLDSPYSGHHRWSMADQGQVAHTLARFVLTFFPEQIRNGNFARATAPSAPPANGAHDDDELAPLLRRAIDDVRVTSVALAHFKNIRSLELDFPPPHPSRGHWTCIAGINGAGKSAVLQALTLALLGDRLAAELGGDRLQRARRVDADGPHDAAIALSLRAGQGAFRLALELDESGVADRDDEPAVSREMRAFWKARPQHHLLRAYGPGRNLSEYIDKRYADRSPHVQAVMTLFDPLTQVASAEAIVEKAADAGFLQHLVPLVNHLFQDLGVVASAEGAALRFASQGASLAAVDLPDGLRATLAWVADLCFAWYAIAAPDERAEGPASMRATVLVDEIDLHLHPKLQRTLVTRLRERLPRVQWVVTTHSPLVLASFDREEIVLLEPDPEHGVRRRPLDRQIMGFTLDEIVRWLMETEAHSAALDAVADGPVDPEERLAFLLSLSPTVGEREARAALDAVRERATGTGGEPPEGGS